MSPAAGTPRVVMACDFHRHYAAMLCGALDRAGADVTLLTRDHDLEFGNVPGAATDFVQAAVGPDVHLELLGGRMRSPSGWARAFGARRALRRRGSGILHLQESIGNDLRLLVAAGARPGRYALTVHDPVRHPGDNDARRVAWLNRRLVISAGLIFVHADALRDELVEVAAPRAPILVVPHGIDPAPASTLPDQPSVLFFGRISHYKGIDTLLDAMARVWDSLPEARLTIAGAGELEPHPGLGDSRVTVLNEHVPDARVSELFAAARCVVLPYRQASQSGVGSRVKPHARPLVVTDLGGLPELVSDGSGLIVPPERPESMAEAIEKLLTDRALAERLGAAGAETAEREGSWDVVAGLTLDAYRAHLAPD